MRTTLTLDPDVAAYIEKVRRDRGMPLKEIVNSMLRQAIQPKGRSVRGNAYVTSVHHGGKCVMDITDVSAAIARAEGDWHR